MGAQMCHRRRAIDDTAAGSDHLSQHREFANDPRFEIEERLDAFPDDDVVQKAICLCLNQQVGIGEGPQ